MLRASLDDERQRLPIDKEREQCDDQKSLARAARRGLGIHRL